MRYNLSFLKPAKKEWDKLPFELQAQFKKKLDERLDVPRVEKDRLSGMTDCYKIKLLSAGYRLVYKVIEQRVIIQVIVVGKRENDIVYKLAKRRLLESEGF
jgi:mRNA interferase RelE/StbE